ncbi:MAG: DUF362 domain-containing protein [archaeon]|nr:DUF362 domain-containing protein [archaeon]
MKKPIVSVARNENITTAVEMALDNLKIPNLSGKKILLKPNVGRNVDSKLAVNTNPVVVKAIYHYLKEKYQATYYIGDSPIISTNSKEAFKKSNYSSLLEEEGLQYLDLDKLPPITLKINKGNIIKEIKVTGYWDEFDYIISIPVLKMHMHTGASLSFKNMKGMIYKRNKISLHQQQKPEVVKEISTELNIEGSKIKELDIAIADLAYVIKPNLSIIDASFALEGMGPASGNAIKMDTIIASNNFMAADIVALALTQPNWTLDDVPHLKVISEKIIPNNPKSLKDIEIIPEKLDKYITQLEKPPSSITIKHDNVFLTDIDSCSSCLSTVFNLVKENLDFINDNFTTDNPLRIAIGKGIIDSNFDKPTFLVGNCTNCRKTDGYFVRGCAPVVSDIMKEIKKYLKEP